MIERRPPTHTLRIEVPLDLEANPAAEKWDIQGALAEATRVLLPMISLGTLGLLCDDVQVSLLTEADRDGGVHAAVSQTYVGGDRAEESLLRIRRWLKEPRDWWTAQDEADYESKVPTT